MVRKPDNKKPPSKKSLAAKAKREKAHIEQEPLADAVRQRLEDAYERSYNRDTGWVEQSYPSERSFEDAGLMNAEEAAAAEEQLYGRRGIPHLDMCPKAIFPMSKMAQCTCPKLEDDLNDNMPEFLQASAKAGPALDALGRTEAEKKRLRMGEPVVEDKKLPVIYAGAPEEAKPKRTITIMRDHDLEYPDLYMAVYVAPDWDVRDDEARFAKLFARSGCYRADTLEEADLVVFGGGSDVEPLLYGESNENKHPSVYFNSERDAADMGTYLQARAQGTPMMGVCRGAQFLHVMNGGRLYQDIDGHQGAHKAFDIRGKQLIENVSSVHHQSCIFNKEGGMEVLLTTANGAKVRWINADEKQVKPVIDIEGFYYRDTGCFGVQGHPEYSGFNKYSVWCLEQVNQLFLMSPDFEWSGKRLQMKPEARDAKEIAAQYLENQFNPTQEV